MKLSIISLISSYAKDVESFLKDLKEQTNQEFEVILCINKNIESKKILNLVAEYSEFFEGRLIAIFNTRTKSYQDNLLNAFNVSRGKFVLTLNSESNLKKNYVEKMIENAEREDVDVLEFKPRIVGTTRFKPKARITPNIKMNVAETPLIFAYSFPFIFNKIFKKSLIKKICNQKIKYTNDSKLCTMVNYLLLMEAKTYTYLDFRIYREYFDADMWFNSNNFLNTMKAIEQISEEKNLHIKEEIRYATYYLLKILISGFFIETSYLHKTLKYLKNSEINYTRNKKLIDKHKNLVVKLENTADFRNLRNQNIYMLIQNEETCLLNKSINKIVVEKILEKLE
ncbi:glycosyltransferase [Mycoplasmopsis glycophila]|uniref:Glycosyl transferase family 2 n=1 Tax=Mycoplasmopsis glycophila TaxID=171285 RepID=A0A449AVB8_9BACT|nr:glycosyltransferase [Mycoplasmopsis glycophila]VEU70420.1 Glycosyl transferase family 2 [Mycoplasmopsis glycophila]